MPVHPWRQFSNLGKKASPRGWQLPWLVSRTRFFATHKQETLVQSAAQCCEQSEPNKQSDTATPASLSPELARLEAILFLSREPLPPRRLATLAELPEGTRLRPLIADLNAFYDRVQRAFSVVHVAGGLQLRTRPAFAQWLFRLQEVPIEQRLTPSCLETLTIIAYKQPVPRADVEAIRGVACGDVLRQLLDFDLILIAGRSDDLGRPFLYGTTKRFLQVFGLSSLDELPPREAKKKSPPDL